MSSEITYTIVTAIHNQIEYNKLFWESLKKYSALPFELIIIDNASTDGSGEYFREQGATVIRNDENRPYSEVQNQGMKLAKTEYIAFLNNDIVVSKDWDAKIINHMERYGIEMMSPAGIENMQCPKAAKFAMRRWRRFNLPQRIKLHFGFQFTRDSLLSLVNGMYCGWERYTQNRDLKFRSFIYPGFAGNAVVARKSLFTKVGPWNEEVAAADFDLSLRTVRRSVQSGDTIVPMVAGDTFVHHFVSATIRKTKRSGSRWNGLKNVTEVYSNEDLRFLHRPKASIIIAVYNRADALEKVLLSLIRQSEENFEIVISDDGSGPEIEELIRKMNGSFCHPIRHIAHENDGFRKTIIANKAVMASRSEYLIFIDGDMILHHSFVERHILRGKPGHIQTGRRIMLGEELTNSISPEDITTGRFEQPAFWKDKLDSREKNPKYGYYLPSLYNLLNLVHRNYQLIGCNFSCFKGDFISVNGYDERVIGRGLEDNNLGNRFKRKGLRIDYISQEAIQYHLHHSFEPIPHSPEIIREFGEPSEFWADQGIIKS